MVSDLLKWFHTLDIYTLPLTSLLSRGKIQHKQNKCSQGCTNIGRLGLARSLQQTQTKFDVVYHWPVPFFLQSATTIFLRFLMIMQVFGVVVATYLVQLYFSWCRSTSTLFGVDSWPVRFSVYKISLFMCLTRRCIF